MIARFPSRIEQDLFSKVGPHYYFRIDKKFSGDRKKKIDGIMNALPDHIAGLKVTDFTDTDGFKFSFEDGGWLLIRFSGTEALIRVYCETTHKDKVQAIINAGLGIAGISKQN